MNPCWCQEFGVKVHPELCRAANVLIEQFELDPEPDPQYEGAVESGFLIADSGLQLRFRVLCDAVLEMSLIGSGTSPAALLYPDREADYDPMTSRVLDLISAWSWAGRVPLEIARQQRVDPERHACKQTRAALS